MWGRLQGISGRKRFVPSRGTNKHLHDETEVAYKEQTACDQYFQDSQPAASVIALNLNVICTGSASANPLRHHVAKTQF